MGAKELARISHVSYGFGGYQGAMFGLSLTFEGDGIGVGTFHGTWPLAMERSEHAKWSEEDRRQYALDALRRLEDTLRAAGKDSVEQLVGTPVELEFKGDCAIGTTLENWRVLTEVLPKSNR
jgi:hypothetical protein